MFARSSNVNEPIVSEPRSRDGFALFMALGALVIIAVLVAGSSFITMQETRLGQNQLVETKAFSAAEYGLNRIQADWDKTPNLQMSIGAKFDTTYLLNGVGTSTVRYVRLNNETFWIVSEGRATVGNSLSASRVAIKRVGAILRLRVPSVRAEGAVTTAGDVSVGGAATIRGANSDPPGENGCANPKAADKAALVVGSTASVSINKPSNVTGSPQITQSAFAADSNTYVRFGDETWTALVASANVTTSGAVSDSRPSTNADGSCNKNDPLNWGEPWRSPTAGRVDACANYYPIVYITGSTDSQHGRGQGILLVNGDLRFNAGFEWHGLIIVKDDITKANGHASIYGAIMARNAVNDAQVEDFTGTVDIFYSSCALDYAMRGSAQVVQAKDRSWVELY